MSRTPPKVLTLCKALVGTIVILKREVVTKGGKHFPAGTRMRVEGTWRGRFHLQAVTPYGRDRWSKGDSLYVRSVGRYSFEPESPHMRDLVSRRAALRAIDELRSAVLERTTEWYALNKAWRAVDRLPSPMTHLRNAEPRTARLHKPDRPRR